MNAAGGRSIVALSVAGIAVSVESRAPDLRLALDETSARFAIDPSRADIVLTIDWCDEREPVRHPLLFDSGGVWRLYGDAVRRRFECRSARFGETPYKTATVTRDYRRGHIALRRECFDASHAIHPLEYPLDEVLMVHRLGNSHGIELHGCGLVTREGDGLLFVGASGVGKTTTACLWEGRGARVLSDDRIVLRREGDTVWMHGTPWHGEARLAMAERARLRKVFLLRHAQDNARREVARATAVARLFAHAFVAFHDDGALDGALATLAQVVDAVPVFDLGFVPDASSFAWVEGA